MMQMEDSMSSCQVDAINLAWHAIFGHHLYDLNMQAKFISLIWESKLIYDNSNICNPKL